MADQQKVVHGLSHNFIHESMADTKYRYVLEKNKNIYKQKINRCKIILTTTN